MAGVFSLPFLLHLVILLSSVSCACVAGLYLHPLQLFSFLAASVSCLGAALRTHIAKPLLFFLLNLLVAALYVTSSIMPQDNRGQQQDAEINLKMDEDSNLAQWPKQPSRDGLPDDNPLCNNALSGDVDEVRRLGTQKRHAKSWPRSRLARSKSDGILSLAAAGKSPMELRAVPRLLKKAGTFEPAWRHRRVKPVVVVEDPPEDGQVAEEEVDKKAEEFIGRFYQRVKLQRLASLKRA